jgi:hypothetical protein
VLRVTCRESSRFTFHVSRLTLAALILLSLSFEIRGWGALRAGRAQVAAWQAAVAARPTAALVTDRWWLPLRLAPAFAGHPWFLVPGSDRWAAWPAVARQAGLPDFTTLTVDPPPALPGATTGPSATVDGLTIQQNTLAR